MLTTAQQVWLKKLGGATVRINELGPVTKPGSGRRMGEPVGSDDYMWTPPAPPAPPEAAAAAGNGAAAAGTEEGAAPQALAAAASVEEGAAAMGMIATTAAAKVVNRRCKRPRLQAAVAPAEVEAQPAAITA